MDSRETQTKIDRRGFLHSAAAATAGLAFPPAVFAQTSKGKKPDDINVAMLGVGEQGQVLMSACLKIPGIRIKAVCDIWEAYNRKRVSRVLGKYHHEHNTYVDYKEMLDKEKDLDAVIIATPDFWHAEHTVDCLNAGLHVYCEKEMSNTLEGARRMVLTAKRTGKLLQIGHQRRSNPRYVFCYENLIKGARLLGQITAVNGQWNRRASEPLGWPKNAPISQAVLEKYGYVSMERFKNWRWYKGLGAGPMVDLGSHQIDIYNWFLQANPKTVIASGRTNFYDPKTHQWPDTMMVVYEYETPWGNVTAFYQTISSSASGGYFENFMGNEGSLIISERANRCEIYRDERTAPKWDQWVEDGLLYKQCDCEIEYIEKAKKESIQKCGCPQITERTTGAVLDVRETPLPPKYDLPVAMDKKPHQMHLENFFDAIYSGGKVALNCPAEVGYETAVAVLKANEAVEAGRKLEFKPDEFVV
jgi:predicted dehydrogenase